MEEKITWEKKDSIKNDFAAKLDSLMNDVVMSELNDINSKIESLCSMGVIENDSSLEELREKMKQLREKNVNSK
ncbi:MAG: hypothetical protein PHF86_04720 [Candidatus Nanoarchaeia archaeon]|jgi:hypothetical protein|nr:hypothetical protein [Candidatus Nanoarchaeia archaeon]